MVHGQKKEALLQWNFNTNEDGYDFEGLDKRAEIPSNTGSPQVNINMRSKMLNNSKVMQSSSSSASPQYDEHNILHTVLCKWVVWFCCICMSGLVMRYFKANIFNAIVGCPTNWILIAAPIIGYTFTTARIKSKIEDAFSGVSNSRLDSVNSKELHAPKYQGTQDKKSKPLLLVL